MEILTDLHLEPRYSQSNCYYTNVYIFITILPISRVNVYLRTN